MNTLPRPGLVVAVCLCGLASMGSTNSAALDLDDPRQRLDAYIRANGDTSGAESVTYARATVYAQVPGAKPNPLFNLEIVGVSRYQPIEGGYARLHREIGYYTDLKTGEVLERWRNPYTDREVRVLPIENDPVNRRFTIDRMTFKVLESGDQVIFYREVPLRYPNVLDREQYPRYSSGDFYEAMEMFNTFVRRSDLENPSLTAVPSVGSWSRLGPWLPWMEMGQHQGQLVYHSQSLKPLDGLDGVPDALRARIARDHPAYLHAPTEWTEPDETSWTFFKKKIDAERAGR